MCFESFLVTNKIDLITEEKEACVSKSENFAAKLKSNLGAIQHKLNEKIRERDMFRKDRLKLKCCADIGGLIYLT